MAANYTRKYCVGNNCVSGHFTTNTENGLKMKKLQLTFVLLLILCVSCKRSPSYEQLVTNRDLKFGKVLIIFYPSFQIASLIMLDMENKEVLFQRVGNKILYKPFSLSEDTSEKEYAPESMRFNLSQNQYEYLKDSLLSKFSDSDYVDRYLEMEDGITNSILFTLKSGSVIDVETNERTLNQKMLIRQLISLAIINQKDSVSLSYFKRLSQSY